METGIATATGAKGSLATVGTGAKGSLVSVGTATKALALAHPLTMAVTGGALLGISAYYAINNYRKRRAVAPEAEEGMEAVAT